MLERLTEVFCEVDDFCQAFETQWQNYMLGSAAPPRGPQPGLAVSEIITLLLVLHSSGFKYLKHFYQGVCPALAAPMFSGHAVLRAIRDDTETSFCTADVLPAQPLGQQDWHLLHRQHRAAGV